MTGATSCTMEEAEAQGSAEALPFRALIDSSPVATLLCRLSDLSVVYANPQAGELLRRVGADSSAERLPAPLRDCIELRRTVLRAGFGKRMKAEVELEGERLDIEIAAVADGPGPASHAALFLGMGAEAAASEAALWHMAHHDPLTDLPNRAFLLARLEQAVTAPRQDAPGLAIHCLDLDRFKLVNDLLGHPAGDSLLKQVADRLRSVVGDRDLVSRQGGDEFTILQAIDGEPAAAQKLARRVIEAVSRPYMLDGQQFEIGTSVGIALHPRDGDTPTDLLKHADIALYAAKNAARGTARFFEPALDARLKRRHTLERELGRALRANDLRLEFQPIFRTEGRALEGFEALLRWDHPQRGTLAPSEFVPLAEETGLIHELGAFVLRSVCVEAAGWSSPYPVSVNLSPLQFRRPEFLRMVRDTLRDTGLSPGRLTLEVTEGLLIRNPQQAEAMLRDLHSLGVKLALDDFGTGYSSLSYLLRFPFHQLKIDRSFVSLIGEKAEATSIVEAILTLAASLKLRVVAEGVENANQLLQLSFMKCELVQGYYLARPLRPAAVGTLIAERPLADLRFGKDWVRQAMSARRPAPVARPRGGALVIPPPPPKK